MKKLFKEFTKGLVKENPIFVLVLGMCPTLAVTTSAENGLGMGAAATVVLLGSNIVISMLRKIIPDKVRIPAYITVIAGFVTVVQLLLKAYLPDLDQALGIFIPLIVVNCIILARAEQRNKFCGRCPGNGAGFHTCIVCNRFCKRNFGNRRILWNGSDRRGCYTGYIIHSSCRRIPGAWSADGFFQ